MEKNLDEIFLKKRDKNEIRIKLLSLVVLGLILIFLIIQFQ